MVIFIEMKTIHLLKTLKFIDETDLRPFFIDSSGYGGENIEEYKELTWFFSVSFL